MGTNGISSASCHCDQKVASVAEHKDAVEKRERETAEEGMMAVAVRSARMLRRSSARVFDDLAAQKFKRVLLLLQKSRRLLQRRENEQTNAENVVKEWRKIANRIDSIFFLVSLLFALSLPVVLFGKYFMDELLLADVDTMPIQCGINARRPNQPRFVGSSSN